MKGMVGVAAAGVSKKDILNRLSRLEGQIRGVKKMIEEGKDCEKIVIQLSAVHAALEGVSKLIVVHFFSECLQESRNKGGGEEEALQRLASLVLNTRL